MSVCGYVLEVVHLCGCIQNFVNMTEDKLLSARSSNLALIFLLWEEDERRRCGGMLILVVGKLHACYQLGGAGWDCV